MEIVSKKIEDLVTENFNYASALHQLGIAFYQYFDKTLAQVCQDKGLQLEQIIKKLQNLGHEALELSKLSNYTVDVLIEYLRHMHHVFIHQKMPYLLHLIENYEPKPIPAHKFIIKDLQLLFPLFIDDFIHHIHEEEDTFFGHILVLHQATKSDYNWGKLFFQMEQNSIQAFALMHNSHDDEMKGIREITQNYTLEKQAPLHLQVIFAELKTLENDLKLHAKIEDEVLFPKALQLEEQVKLQLKSKILFN